MFYTPGWNIEPTRRTALAVQARQTRPALLPNHATARTHAGLCPAPDWLHHRASTGRYPAPKWLEILYLGFRFTRDLNRFREATRTAAVLKPGLHRRTGSKARAPSRTAKAHPQAETQDPNRIPQRAAGG
ncbi:MAG: hypothetical protein LC114_08985 [Bryobacterales bacterium]|nr:hypothetical protein [Bryobacterales bacterium]